MPLPDMLPVADFFAGLKIAEVEFDAPAVQQISRTAGGEILQADLGARLWRGRVTLAPAYHDDADEVRALLSYLSQAGRSFLVHPVPRIGPKSDPLGTVLGSNAPTIHTLTGTRELRVTGLPSAYVLSRGDYLSFTYSSNPTRYALHQIVTGGTASAGGLTPLMEVTPPIRPGAVTGAAVTLVRPVCKALFSAPAGYGTRRPRISDGLGFDFIQTLR
jgi:hypothetical protein